MPNPHFGQLFGPHNFSNEIVFTVAAVIFCFLIYFKTKESYDLTRYTGIRYFRDAFLLFGLSYALRFLFSLFFLSTIAFDFIIPRRMFVPFFILPLGYFSTMGIFYLIFSLIWKRFDNKKLLIIGHSIAVLLSVVSFITRSHRILIFLQFIFLIIAVVLSFVVHQRGKKLSHKLSQIRILYLLIAALWLINLLIVDRRRPFNYEIEIFFQVISLCVFFIIYHKISKWVK